MWVVDQKGKNTFDLSRVAMFTLEDKTEDMIKYHPAYHGRVSVIRLYYDVHSTDGYKTIAVYADENEANLVYHEFIKAIAEGWPVFDFSGYYSAKNQEIAEADARGGNEQSLV